MERSIVWGGQCWGTIRAMQTQPIPKGLSATILPDAPIANRAHKTKPFADVEAQDRAAGSVRLSELADEVEVGADVPTEPTPPVP